MRNCSDIEPELSAYHDGELSPSERAVVQEHIANCPACQTALAAVEAARVELSALPKLKSPAGLRDRVKGQLVPQIAPVPDRSVNVTQGRFGWVALASGIAATGMLAILGYTYFSNPAATKRESDVALQTAPAGRDKDVKNSEKAVIEEQRATTSPADALTKADSKDRANFEDGVRAGRAEKESVQDQPIAKPEPQGVERKSAPLANKDAAERLRQLNATETAPAASAPLAAREAKRLEEELAREQVSDAPRPDAKSRAPAPTPAEPAPIAPGKPSELRAKTENMPKAPPAPVTEPPPTAASAAPEARKQEAEGTRFRAERLEKGIAEKAKTEESAKSNLAGGAPEQPAKKSAAVESVTREVKPTSETKKPEAGKDVNDAKLSIESQVRQQGAAQPDTGLSRGNRAPAGEQKAEDEAPANRRSRGAFGGGGGGGRGGAAPKTDAPGQKPANGIPQAEPVMIHTADVEATFHALRVLAAARNITIAANDGKALEPVKLADGYRYVKPDAQEKAATTARAFKKLADTKEEYLLMVDADAVAELMNDLKLLQEEARGIGTAKLAPAKPPATMPVAPALPTAPPALKPADPSAAKGPEAVKELADKDKAYRKEQPKVTIRVIIDSTPQK